jgi:hypothetical protein
VTAYQAFASLLAFALLAAAALADPNFGYARFAPERWQAFKRDLAFIGPRIREWPGPLHDRGYNDPPPRALLLHGLGVPATGVTLALLVLAAFAAVWRTFGAVPPRWPSRSSG